MLTLGDGNGERIVILSIILLCSSMRQNGMIIIPLDTPSTPNVSLLNSH
jgi:hypothetical protein